VSAARAAGIDELRARFEQHVRAYCIHSPLYGEICAAIAGDDEALSLMLHAPAHQRRPTLLQAAIHDLLLAGADHELAAYVPTVAGGRTAGGPAGPPALAFCREHRDALAHTLATRSTQTNEVNRAAALLPALVHGVPRGARVRLVELGASAGLNLLLDRFSYRYGAAPVGGGAADAQRPAVICDCAVSGAPALDAPPAIAERIGVDLEPVDLRDARARRWLLACVWPDNPDRVVRLRAAIELALADPPTVVRGDALELLAQLVGPPSELHPVIWPPPLDELGAMRDLTWIGFEQPGEVPGLPATTVPGVAHDPDDCALMVVRYRRGERTVQRVADADGHARAMRWFATPCG
jgi:hypothetical protein